MTSDPPPLDLVVVGAMTIDRFADGSASPGGTVMHVARATAARGLQIGIVTTSGQEPEALAGLAELRGLVSLVEGRTHAQTTVFRHRAGPNDRRLWLDQLGGSVQLDATARNRIFTLAILFAPVADEIPLDALAAWPDRRRGAILQGWLRSTDEGVEVRPLPLSALGPELSEALSQFDLLVASREDLLAESATPSDQVTALRRLVGRRPELIVTDGAEGLWLDTSPGGPRESLHRHVAVPWRVNADSTVGAGDILAAFLTIPFGLPTSDRVQDAMRVVAEVLEDRRLRPKEDDGV
jgi:sugar/nucleoside kinase (ribokinase family)